jgi:ATP-binding cassette subfamily F protein 2
LLLLLLLVQALANREVPIPEHIDMYLLDKEMPASDKIALHVRHSCSSTRQHVQPHFLAMPDPWTLLRAFAYCRE